MITPIPFTDVWPWFKFIAASVYGKVKRRPFSVPVFSRWRAIALRLTEDPA